MTGCRVGPLHFSLFFSYISPLLAPHWYSELVTSKRKPSTIISSFKQLIKHVGASYAHIHHMRKRIRNEHRKKEKMSAKVAKGGMVIGKYELGKTIGEGSFAKVKFARDMNNGNNVAIKILDRKHVLRHNMMEQLKREISTMKLLHHPNVTQIFEVPTLTLYTPPPSYIISLNI